MKEIDRRKFIASSAAAIAGVGSASLGCDNRAETGDLGSSPLGDTPHPSEWWVGGRFVKHDAVNGSRLGEGIIRARVDNTWRDFQVTNLPERFVQWSFQKRIERMQKLADFGFNPEDLDGPHNACVATYGGWSRDSAVSLNTAYKGMGFVPVKHRIEEILALFGEETRKIEMQGGGCMDSMGAKTRFLAKLYEDTSIFDPTKQVSLELFSTPHFATHTFLNMMANPIASASFLAYPTFELRAVPQLLHPDNPTLSDHERLMTDYTNAVHNFVHGGETCMACVYHVIEVFDDTPNSNARGRRIA